MKEKEIDPRDYIKLFIRNKFVFVCVIPITILIGVFAAFYHPVQKTYQVSGMIEIGQLGNRGQTESPQQVVEKIRSGEFGSFPDSIVIVSNPISTYLVKIIIETPDQSKGMDYLNSIINTVIDNHGSIAKSEIQKQKTLLKDIEGKIYQLKNERIYLAEKLDASPLSLQGLLSVAMIGSIDNSLADLYSQKVSTDESLDGIILTKKIGLILTSEKSGRNNIVINIAIAVLAGLFLSVYWIFLRNWMRDK